MLSKKQSEFVTHIIEGTPPGQAYKLAFAPKTDNADSLRAMASKERRKPEVNAAIEDGLQALKAEAIQGALWNFRASVISRMNDIETIDMEIQRRLDGLDMEIEGIQAHWYAPSEKKQLIGKAMQRALIGRDLLATKQMIYASLDAMAGGSDRPESAAARFIDATTFDENPNDYAATPQALFTVDSETSETD